MLCQFTVKNFKSIRDEMTFDMQAAAISEHEDKVIMDKNGEQFLPVSAIYGPNGGGKSNVNIWSKWWWKIKCLGSIAYCGSKSVTPVVCNRR